MDRKSPDELQEHMLGTYYGLRVGLAVIGIALPLIVLIAGVVLHHVWLEPSISDYYHTQPNTRFFTTRDLFVGGLLATGACLYLYKGFSTRENVALNLAGGFATIVALFPNAGPNRDGGMIPKLHATAAVLFFLCIAYVSIFRSRDTLRLLPPASRPNYEKWYFSTGLAMVVSPLAAVVLSYVFQPGSHIFWVESLGVWAFAAYWITKTREMRESRAEKRALDAELRREAVPAAPDDASASLSSGVFAGISRRLSPKSDKVERVVPVNPPSAL